MYMFYICYKHVYKPRFYECQDFLRILFKTTCAPGLHLKKNKAFLFFHCCSVLYEWQLQGRTDLVSVWDDKSMKDQCQTREDKWNTKCPVNMIQCWQRRQHNSISTENTRKIKAIYQFHCPRFLSTSNLCQWVQVKGSQRSVEPPSGLSGWLINGFVNQWLLFYFICKGSPCYSSQ